MLTAAAGLLVGQHRQAVAVRGTGQARGDVAGAVQPVEDEDAPAQAARVEAPFFLWDHKAWAHAKTPRQRRKIVLALRLGVFA